jgi:hypothetical protein
MLVAIAHAMASRQTWNDWRELVAMNYLLKRKYGGSRLDAQPARILGRGGRLADEIVG